METRPPDPACGSVAAKLSQNCSQKWKRCPGQTWKLQGTARGPGRPVAYVPLPNLETAAKNGNSAAGSCLWECRCQTRKLGRRYWPPEWCCQKWKLQPKMETRPPDPACGSAVAKLRNYAGGTWPMGVVLPKMETAAKNGNSAMGECTHPPLQTIMDNHPNLEVAGLRHKVPR